MGAFEKQISQQQRVPRARRLVLVLGDQLDADARALSQLDREEDVVLMVEAEREATHVPTHRQRTTLFLSAMRHFALQLVGRGVPLRYVPLRDARNTQSLGSELRRAIDQLSPERVSVTKPGEHRVEREVREACRGAGVSLDIEPDDSFTCSLEAFDEWAGNRKDFVMEYFYRSRRRALDVLMQKGKPVDGAWNFDKENRKAFESRPNVPRPYFARPDEVTEDVMTLVERCFPEAPGYMEHFRWPVTRAEARRALDNFIDKRLPEFGPFEDAMWAGEPVLYHSRLSAALNLKLLDPRECVDAALAAYESGHAPINSVEGFVRQIIGWREFIRGVYFHEGTDYTNRNTLGHEGRLPSFYWTGETEMACMRHSLTEVIENAWGHHIPRLMVIGNFALISGIHPRAVHEWFLGMYVDAVEWVTAPNVVGMSQHADGGVVGTKPYAGSGKYIQRMSNYCDRCRYNPAVRTGDDACPFNVFYWDFLLRHRPRFEKNPRMAMALKNAARIERGEARSIRRQGDALRAAFEV